MTHLIADGAKHTLCGESLPQDDSVPVRICSACVDTITAVEIEADAISTSPPASLLPGLRRALVIAKSLRSAPNSIEAHIELELERRGES